MRFAPLIFVATTLAAQTVPLLPDAQISVLSEEISGESAKRNLEGLSRLHRMRGSRDFHRAAELVLGELQKYGYADAHIEKLSWKYRGAAFHHAGDQRVILRIKPAFVMERNA